MSRQRSSSPMRSLGLASLNVIQETTQLLKDSKRRIIHTIREKTGAVESTKDGVFDSNAEKLKNSEQQLNDLLKSANKMITSSRSYITSNADLCANLLKGLHHDNMTLSDSNSNSKSNFENSKKLYLAWQDIGNVTWEVVQKTYDHYIFGPVTQLIAEEYAPLKLRINERKAVVTDYDAHKYTLANFNKKENMDLNKISKWEHKVLKDSSLLKEMTKSINERILVVTATSKKVIEEAFVATYVAQKFLTEQVQLKTIESMQSMDKEGLMCEIENEINNILSATVSNIKIPRRSMSFSDFFKPPMAPHHVENEQENINPHSFKPPTLRITGMDSSRGTTPLSTPRTNRSDRENRRISTGSASSVVTAPPVPPKRYASSRSAPQSPSNRVNTLPPATNNNKPVDLSYKNDNDSEYNSSADEEEESDEGKHSTGKDNQSTTSTIRGELGSHRNLHDVDYDTASVTSYHDAPLSKLLIACDNYEAKSYSELTLHTGDTIIVQSRDKDGIWATGLCNGAQGRFMLEYTKPTMLFL